VFTIQCKIPFHSIKIYLFIYLFILFMLNPLRVL